MSWHHHQLLCGWSETLPAVNIGDWCATVDKVLRSLAMPTSVHDDTEFVRYSICHMLFVHSLYLTAHSGTSSQWRSACSSYCVRPRSNFLVPLGLPHSTKVFSSLATACSVFCKQINPMAFVCRSPVAKFLLEGGQTQSWLLGNSIISVTTSSGARVGQAGLCDKCLNVARSVTGREAPSSSTQAVIVFLLKLK